MTGAQQVSFLAAARIVLADAGRPMTSREITDEALRRGLIHTAGKTPQKSMDAQLYVRSKEPGAPIVRVFEPGSGAMRARRGSVLWKLAQD